MVFLFPCLVVRKPPRNSIRDVFSETRFNDNLDKNIGDSQSSCCHVLKVHSHHDGENGFEKRLLCCTLSNLPSR